ncbi:ADP-ribosyltransferase [Prosthecodimorpha staleyi]|uniref:NAD(+)--protein-arginine ADP-ribosyltransferase n=1 Tax=Prosthecodimorpha staleyi TaxID=2840188 RepID=A0A947D8F6_9HYPH|nr:ADP-ribosyltransferase [Prosthecodimorpha staleyi]MBT9290127.1 ADP-ribosyltransferase [Prosthecodimorpha staleyi]
MFQHAFNRLLGSERCQELLDRPDIKDGIGDLSTWERLAIYVYTTTEGYHLEINRALRSGRCPGHIQIVANCLSSALSKLPPYSGVTYRGMNMRLEERRQLFARPEVTLYGFTSTTTTLAAIDGFKGNTQLIVYGLSGRLIEYYTSMPGENEVLFAPGARFRVERAIYEEDGDGALFELRELVGHVD